MNSLVLCVISELFQLYDIAVLVCCEFKHLKRCISEIRYVRVFLITRHRSIVHQILYIGDRILNCIGKSFNYDVVRGILPSSTLKTVCPSELGIALSSSIFLQYILCVYKKKQNLVTFCFVLSITDFFGYSIEYAEVFFLALNSSPLWRGPQNDCLLIR